LPFLLSVPFGLSVLLTQHFVLLIASCLLLSLTALCGRWLLRLSASLLLLGLGWLLRFLGRRAWYLAGRGQNHMHGIAFHARPKFHNPFVANFVNQPL
jgi:hypothetical protein